MRRLFHFTQLIVKGCEQLVRKAGVISSWLNVLLVIVISLDVLFRYSLNHTSVWVTELEWHIFAIIFLLGAAYTLQEDRHVRVDVFLQHVSPRQRKLVNLGGHIFLLIPLCLFLIPPAWDYFYQSWRIGEGSGDPGGIPALYPIKALIPLSFLLILTQAITESAKIIMDLYSPEARNQSN